MTVFLLIRHAAHELGPAVLPGRRMGVHLSGEGRRQAERLAGRLAGAGIGAVYCSPMERAKETAAAVAERAGREPVVAAELNEVDLGEWSGRAIADLEADPRWKRWNGVRSMARAPGGEMLVEVQARALRLMERLGAEHGEGVVALVSHGDVIRAVLVHCLGMPLDYVLRIEVGLASVSVVETGEWAPRVVCINSTGELPAI